MTIRYGEVGTDTSLDALVSQRGQDVFQNYAEVDKSCFFMTAPLQVSALVSIGLTS